MKNDNRIFNNLQRATSPELNLLQELSSRLTSDSTGFSTAHRIDGLSITTSNDGTIDVDVGTALLPNPSKISVEPTMLVGALRVETGASIPATNVWCRVSVSFAPQTVTTAPIDIYNPNTQTFAPTLLPVQAVNALAITVTAGAAAAYPASIANHLTIGFVYYTGTSTYVSQVRTWGADAILSQPYMYYGTAAGYLENSIRILGNGNITWLTTAECSAGRVKCKITNVQPSTLLDSGSFANGTLYHLYLMCPGDLATTDNATGYTGIPVISLLAPALGERTRTLAGGQHQGVQYPGGLAVYCGSLFFVSSSNWLPWTISGNEISMDGESPGYVNTVGATSVASATMFSGAFSSALPPRRFVRYACKAVVNGNNPTSVGSRFNFALTGQLGALIDTNRAKVEEVYAFPVSLELRAREFWTGPSTQPSSEVDVTAGLSNFQFVVRVTGVRF